MESKINNIILHEVEKKNIKMGVRYLLKTHNKDGKAIWWVGDFHVSRERVWRKNEHRYEEVEALGSELSGLSFVLMEKIDAVYSLPEVV